MVFLHKEYILIMDSVKNIYLYHIESKQPINQSKQSDKRIAYEIFENSNFIELHPTDLCMQELQVKTK